MNRCVWLTLFLVAGAASPAWGQAVEFNRDIRPILSEYCFACHGPDKPKRKADLRLDLEKEAFADLGGHFALVAGKPGDSAVYRRLLEKDPRRRMPPASTGKTLSAKQIELVGRWIEQGAAYQPHWAFIAPKQHALPKVRNEKWIRNPIDRFILARLEAEGLSPSREADRRTLLRRLSFDLIGLPPSAAEMDAFLNDPAADALDKAVDRLLASRHFGERMAMYWLDLVRFADTGGYHSDNHRDVALYRDYVITAFNNNKRFDRFTIEQLAGDLLPSATTEQKIASGYNRLLMTTEEGGAQAKEYLAKYAADRVRNASAVWLGLTMGCAECHDHKFDPITTKEFYRFASFWADIQEKAVGRQEQTKIPTPDYALKMQALHGALSELRKTLDTPTPTLVGGQRLWEERITGEQDKTSPIWTTLRPDGVVSSGGATLVVQDDRSVLSTGKNPDKDTYIITLKTDLKHITGVRLAVLRHPSLGGELSRGNGNFVLTGVRVESRGPDGKPRPIKLAQAEADFSQPNFPVASLLTAKRGKGWAVEGHLRKGVDHKAVFTFARPVQGGPATTLTVRLEHASNFPRHNIGRFRLDLTTVDKPGLGDTGLPDAVAQALLAGSSKRTDAQRKTLAAYYRSIAVELAPTRRKIAELERQQADLEKAQPQTLISISGPPRLLRVLKRGNWLDDSGEIVVSGTPASLPPLAPLSPLGRGVGGEGPNSRATRLDLANWLVRPDHPLTARVFVNRLWKITFGHGIARSLEDFGSQGDWPTHPELLDWLAREFIASGWDVKYLVKLMATSAAYRQTSRESEVLRHRDPYNHLLARQSRFRLDAEMVRDNALAVSGLLSGKLGGPSVKPYQPAGYWVYLNFPRRTYVEDVGEDQHRRGMYTYWQRTFPHPSLIAFDAPSREECTVERPRSNTPQQALVLLNDVTYVEAARALAETTLRQSGPTDADRLDFAYRRVLGRKAERPEADVLLPLLNRHLKQYRNDTEAVDGLLSMGQTAVGKDVDRPALAAWTSLTRILLNLHETITRE